MTIVIKGMEMPMRCGDCLFYGLESAGHGMFYDFCKGGKFILCSPDNEIDENCPLIPVPTPHGRLIDADALLTDANKLRYGEGWLITVENIEAAPTVMEAEVTE